MAKQEVLTVKQLKEEIIKLGGVESLPKKGSGSGKNGNIIKKDLIKVYEELKTKKEVISKTSPKIKRIKIYY